MITHDHTLRSPRDVSPLLIVHCTQQSVLGAAGGTGSVARFSMCELCVSYVKSELSSAAVFTVTTTLVTTGHWSTSLC